VNNTHTLTETQVNKTHKKGKEIKRVSERMREKEKEEEREKRTEKKKKKKL
jgi:hypothetical protein